MICDGSETIRLFDKISATSSLTVATVLKTCDYHLKRID